jgi:hypothetical protein
VEWVGWIRVLCCYVPFPLKVLGGVLVLNILSFCMEGFSQFIFSTYRIVFLVTRGGGLIPWAGESMYGVFWFDCRQYAYICIFLEGVRHLYSYMCSGNGSGFQFLTILDRGRRKVILLVGLPVC